VDNSDDVRLLLASRYPLIVAKERDEPRLMDLFRRAAAALGLPVWTWSSIQGLVRDGFSAQYGTQDPGRALAFLCQVPDPGVFLFMDALPALSNPVWVRQVKEMAQAARQGQTLVLCGAGIKAPPELDGLAVAWALKAPDRAELDQLVRTTMHRLQDRGLAVALDDGGVATLADALRGLSATEADRAIQQEAMKDGKLDAADIPGIRRAKAELLRSDGPLELVDTAGTFDAVGGMEHLKDWLGLRGKALEPAAQAAGLDPPRGVLLTGVPGCGKSLVAKTLAGTWGLPLILLDPSRLYGPYVGESEKRLDGALHAVETMAPSVLWIDEIEKGFAAGGTDDGGVGERVLGTFLRWMQDRPAGVFVIATANDVESLPPEFLRKGRFDEIFFVDLPGANERAQIFRLHLAKRHRDPAAFDLPKLGAAADGFSGAEIEAAVAGALYRAYAAGRDLTTDDILAEIQASPPLSRTRAEDVARLRAWAKGRAVPV
jgi:hypothetical protein